VVTRPGRLVDPGAWGIYPYRRHQDSPLQFPIPTADGELDVRDDTQLFQHVWQPSGAPRGTVLIAHGLGEHAGRYAQLAGELTSDGWCVRAMDHRGHGRSPGARGAIPTPTAIRDDILDALAAARRAQPNQPLILLGHSMGGAFAAEAIVHVPSAADALVLSSPALLADLTPVQRGLMNTMRHVAPNLAIANGLTAQYLSHDRAVVAAYLADPLVHDRVSARLAHAIVTAGTTALAAAPRWTVPTLLLYAGDDRIVNPRGSAAFAAAAPADVVTVQRFDGLWHEIFNEIERAGPVAAVRRWLDAFTR
jgi:alpha-beta hydrolase superfamily lysophospholipase